MFFFVCLQSKLLSVSHDMCSAQGRQEKTITPLEPQFVFTSITVM